MVYMAGGGKVTDAARESLMRMKEGMQEVDPDKDFDIFAHFDFGRGKTTKRYHLTGVDVAATTRKLMRAFNTNRALRDEALTYIENVRASKDLKELRVSPEVCKGLDVGADGQTMDSILEQLIGTEPKKNLQRRCMEKEEWKTRTNDPEELKEKLKDLILESALEQDGEDIGDTDTSDPKDLQRFIHEVCRKSDSDYRMVIIWGHGD